MLDIKKITSAELKKSFADHQNSDDVFNEALSELLNRNSNTRGYPADMPLEEIEKVLRNRINGEK